MTTLAALRQMPDHELGTVDTPDAAAVLTGRARAATQIRLILARTYGRRGMSTHSSWAVLPYLTSDGTVGILDIAHGTAWDTGVTADPGVEDLGLGEPTGEAYAAANTHSPGAIRFGRRAADGTWNMETVQSEGTAVVDGQVVPPSAPPGWRQIALPTWRGYDPAAHYYTEVPIFEFRPETWIRPRLVAAGLMTCYARPGKQSDGEHLTSTHGWDAHWPHGVPDWIDGRSVTVLDRIARTLPGEPPTHLILTWAARGTDAEEIDVLRPLLAHWRVTTAKSWEWSAKTMRRVPALADRADAVREAADAIAAGQEPTEEARRAVNVAAQQQYDYIGGAARSDYAGLVGAEDGLTRHSPWEAADALARCGRAGRILGDVWPATKGEARR